MLASDSNRLQGRCQFAHALESGNEREWDKSLGIHPLAEIVVLAKVVDRQVVFHLQLDDGDQARGPQLVVGNRRELRWRRLVESWSDRIRSVDFVAVNSPSQTIAQWNHGTASGCVASLLTRRRRRQHHLLRERHLVARGTVWPVLPRGIAGRQTRRDKHCLVRVRRLVVVGVTSNASATTSMATTSSFSARLAPLTSRMERRLLESGIVRVLAIVDESLGSRTRVHAGALSL
jgi:hypothetical protein